MEDKDRLKETYDHLVAYLKERFELLRFEIADRSAREASSFVSKLVLVAVVLLAFLFLSIALALYLGNLFESMTLGFAAVGGAYIFLFMVLALLRKPLIERPMVNGAIKRFFKGNKEDE